MNYFKGFLFLFFALVPGSLGALPDGNDLLKEIDKIRYPESFFMRVRLDTQAPGEDLKSMTMENQFRKGLGTYMEIQAPARSKGTRFLNKDSTLWMFNPKSGSNRPLRLASQDSFQGSAFSNSDVSKTTYQDDYNGITEGEETINHSEFGPTIAYRIRAEAKHPGAPYGKIIIWIRKSDLVPLKFDYYAKSGLLYRKMVSSQYKILAGRLRATHMEMESLDKVGTKSIITIEAMELRNNIPDSLFNLNNLTR